MNVAISSFERDLLLVHPETIAIARQLLIEDDDLFLVGTDGQFDALREACSDLLQRIGFDEEYEPTREGTALEGLLDKLLV